MSRELIARGDLLKGDALESEYAHRRKDYLEEAIPPGAPIKGDYVVHLLHL